MEDFTQVSLVITTKIECPREVYLDIPGIGRVIAIWDEVFFKLRVSFDGLVTRKKVLSESSHRIDAHLIVIIEALEINSSFSFEFCIYSELI